MRMPAMASSGGHGSGSMVPQLAVYNLGSEHVVHKMGVLVGCG